MTTPDRTPADFGWTERPRIPALWDALVDDHARVTLGMVASAHYLSISQERSEVREEARLLKRHLRAKFERQNGPIRNSYFCQNLPGAIALVEDPIALHTVLNSDNDRLVALEADCHALANQTHTLFAESPAQPPLTDAVYSAMTRVLAAADIAAAGDEERLAPALEAAEVEVKRVRQRVLESIQRKARFVYLQGTVAGTVVVMIVSVALGLVSARYWANYLDTKALVGATLFGGLGAVVSVFQRTSTGRLLVDFEATRLQLFSLGTLRPMVGAIFGAVAQFALSAGLFSMGEQPATALGVFALVGFAAGFSERFATDMVERTGRVLGQ